MLTAAVAGASGYVGGELLRLLVGHPGITVDRATSRRLAGRPVHRAHPNLRGVTDLKFRPPEGLGEPDVLFLCLPAGRAAAGMDGYASRADTVVDCSPDFRLRDPEAHAARYGGEGTAPGWRRRSVYGLPETRRGGLPGARLVAAPGCNATAVTLALLPLAGRGLVERAVADVKVGSSEAGSGPSRGSHHPERSGAVRPYAPTDHRHRPEVAQETGLDEARLHFTATAVERVRGVQAAVHVFPPRAVDDEEVSDAFRSACRGEPFLRICRGRGDGPRFPEPGVVAGTNFCDLAWEVEDGGERVVVLSALDNLVKGAAGSAVQATNVARGLDEAAGLGFPGLHPS